MAVVFDTATVSGSAINNVSTFGFSSGSVTGSDRMGIVALSHGGPASPSAATAVTWGAGNAMAAVSQQVNTANNDVNAELWALLGIPTGVSTVSGTFPQGGHYGVVSAWSFTGAGGTSGATGTTNLSGTSTSVNVTSAAGDLVIDCFAVDVAGGNPTSPVAGTGQDAHSTAIVGGANVLGGASEEAGAATVTMSWSWTTANTSAHAAVNITAAAAAGGVGHRVIGGGYGGRTIGA